MSVVFVWMEFRGDFRAGGLSDDVHLSPHYRTRPSKCQVQISRCSIRCVSKSDRIPKLFLIKVCEVCAAWTCRHRPSAKSSATVIDVCSGNLSFQPARSQPSLQRLSYIPENDENRAATDNFCPEWMGEGEQGHRIESQRSQLNPIRVET